MSNWGYWVDLENITLDDNQDFTTWIQAFPLGQYKHPLYGKIDITPAKVQTLADNVKKKVRGTQLDIDYDHKEFSGKAAGWVQDAQARPNGLWIQVQWTEDAYKAIKAGEYKYFSPEFADKWTNPKTQITYQDVLFGGALTNRPFLKDILPINMSELADEGENEVDKFLEELRKTLKLKEDATEEQILQAATTLLAESEQDDDKGDKDEDDKEGEEDEDKEGEEDAEELSENPLIKRLLADVKTLKSENSTLRATTKLSEVNTKLSEWSSPKEGRRYGLPPAVHEDLRSVMLSDKASKMGEVIDKLLEVGLVELGERGGDRNGPTRSGGATASKRFTDKVEELRKANDKLDYVSAANSVAMEDPDLYAAYRTEVLNDSTEA